MIIGDSGRISNVLSLAVDLAKEEQVCDGYVLRLFHSNLVINGFFILAYILECNGDAVFKDAVFN